MQNPTSASFSLDVFFSSLLQDPVLASFGSLFKTEFMTLVASSTPSSAFDNVWSKYYTGLSAQPQMQERLMTHFRTASSSSFLTSSFSSSSSPSFHSSVSAVSSVSVSSSAAIIPQMAVVAAIINKAAALGKSTPPPPSSAAVSASTPPSVGDSLTEPSQKRMRTDRVIQSQTQYHQQTARLPVPPVSLTSSATSPSSFAPSSSGLSLLVAKLTALQQQAISIASEPENEVRSAAQQQLSVSCAGIRDLLNWRDCRSATTRLSGYQPRPPSLPAFPPHSLPAFNHLPLSALHPVSLSSVPVVVSTSPVSPPASAPISSSHPLISGRIMRPPTARASPAPPPAAAAESQELLVFIQSCLSILISSTSVSPSSVQQSVTVPFFVAEELTFAINSEPTQVPPVPSLPPSSASNFLWQAYFPGVCRRFSTLFTPQNNAVLITHLRLFSAQQSPQFLVTNWSIEPAHRGGKYPFPEEFVRHVSDQTRRSIATLSVAGSIPLRTLFEALARVLDVQFQQYQQQQQQKQQQQQAQSTQMNLRSHRSS